MRKDWQTIQDIYVPLNCLHYKLVNGFYVPCGKCIRCMKRMASEWCFRIHQEAESSFVYNALLTYDDAHLKYKGDKPVLEKQHFIDFMKRFRERTYRYFGARLRFFCVGEYGGQYGRPHYHVILFSDTDLRTIQGAHSSLDFISEQLEVAWRKGFCDVEPMNNPGATTRYLVNYLVANNDVRNCDKDIKPFRHMSRNPAIGADWILKHPNLVKAMVERDDYRVPYGKGHMQLPRYYRRKIMPDYMQIAHADLYYERCEEFNHYICLTLNHKERYEYAKKRKEYQQRDQQAFEEQYRARKIHSSCRFAGKVFARREKTRQAHS